MVIFKKKYTDLYGKETQTTIVEDTREDLNLEEMCTLFEDFLRGCSYHFNGHVIIQKEND